MPRGGVEASAPHRSNCASDARPDARGVERESRGLPVGYRWLSGRDARAWPGGAEPFADGEEEPSPGPAGRGW